MLVLAVLHKGRMARMFLKKMGPTAPLQRKPRGSTQAMTIDLKTTVKIYRRMGFRNLHLWKRECGGCKRWWSRSEARVRHPRPPPREGAASWGSQASSQAEEDSEEEEEAEEE